MKKNRMMRLASILLVLVLMTSSVVGGTFAKYTTSASGTDSARVAKWSIEVNDTDIAVGNPSVTLDLFNTVYEIGTTEDDADVANGTDETIIAPGTTGAFYFEIENTSEVTAEYGITFEVVSNEKNIPIQYSLTGADGSWNSNINTLNIGTTTIGMNENGSNADVVWVYWKWAFEGDGVVPAQTNDTDTALGITADDATPPSITVKAAITASQVN